MQTDRRKILEMLAEGKISVQEAERALDPSSASSESESAPNEESTNPGPNQAFSTAEQKPSCMRIVVEKPGKKPVNIRMPFSFPRCGPKIGEMLNPLLRRKLAVLGIEPSHLGEMAGMWSGALANSGFEVENGSGQKVRIFVE
jgi:hypothetical protein